MSPEEKAMSIKAIAFFSKSRIFDKVKIQVRKMLKNVSLNLGKNATHRDYCYTYC